MQSRLSGGCVLPRAPEAPYRQTAFPSGPQVLWGAPLFWVRSTGWRKESLFQSCMLSRTLGRTHIPTFLVLLASQP